jgi:hypothetical protein
MKAKLQTPGTKHQFNTNLQTAKRKEHGAETRFSFGVCNSDKAVLEFGVWSLVF